MMLPWPLEGNCSGFRLQELNFYGPLNPATVFPGCLGKTALRSTG